ncbi:hypothetical protein OIU74_026246 [Salix koriyanagi]|uniref:Uncharacterized protein n=1 Tax=Salix koriyanagi TaxID=2511006 RepID=A0A9Q0VXQ8_9ROSI|nr:hypothetical protein OIU74_026246 [Salix koriyanagi]
METEQDFRKVTGWALKWPLYRKRYSIHDGSGLKRTAITLLVRSCFRSHLNRTRNSPRELGLPTAAHLDLANGMGD